MDTFHYEDFLVFKQNDFKRCRDKYKNDESEKNISVKFGLFGCFPNLTFFIYL
jgi:hypothetical protein